MSDELNSDKPISREEDDLLGRHPLAYRIADMINNLGDDYKDSVVIGIEGEWGSGKSSFINLMLNKVRPEKKNLVIEFNPWNFSDRNKLIEDFFISITDELSESGNIIVSKLYRWLYEHFRFMAKPYKRFKTGSRRVIKLRILRPFVWVVRFLVRLIPYKWLITSSRRVRKLRILRPFVWVVRFLVWLIPWLFSPASVTVSEEIENYASRLLENSDINFSPEISIAGIGFQLPALSKLRWGSHNPLEKQKKEVDKRIEKIGKRIIIVIDDIDRLDKGETRLIFKLARLTADFPNTVFILAYDRNRVAERLDENKDANKIDGGEYLKKIIQQPFLIPKPATEDIFYVLDAAISNELRRAKLDAFLLQHKRLEDLVNSSGFKNLFPTIRDIRRYTNNLRLDLKLFGAETVNSADFVGIEAIRVFAPKVYLAMTNESPLFTGVFSTSKPYDKARKNRIEQIISVAPKGLESSIREIINQLFPQVEGLYINKTPPKPDKWDLMARAWGVCHEGTFDKYFLLSVPATVLSVHELYDFLSAVEKIDDLIEKWETFFEQHKLWLLLRSVCFPSDILDEQLLNTEQRESVELNDQRIENILVSLFNFVENMKDNQRRRISLNRLVREVERTSHVMLEKIEKENRAKHLENIINATTGFFIMADHIPNLIDLVRDEGLENNESRILRWEYVDKIRSAANDGSLANSKGLAPALVIWNEGGPRGEASTYVAKRIDKDEGLLVILKAFVLEPHSRLSSYSPVKILDDLVDICKLYERIRKIDRTKLSEEDASVISSYEWQFEVLGREE